MRHQGGTKSSEAAKKRGGIRSALGVSVAFTIASVAGAAGATYGPGVCEGGSENLACSNAVSRLLVGDDLALPQTDLIQPEFAAGMDGNRLGGPARLGEVGPAADGAIPAPEAQEVAAQQPVDPALDPGLEPAGQEAQNAPVADTERPSVPRGLRLRNVGASAAISWVPSTDNVGVVGYEIYRSDEQGMLGVLVGRSAEADHYDRGLSNGTYWYYIKSVDAAGNTSWRSGMKSVTIFGGADGDRPTTPSSLVATVQGSAVALSWTGSTDETSPVIGYVVFYATNNGGVGVPTGFTTTTTFLDEGLAAGTYWFYVQAEDDSGSISLPSQRQRVTVTDGAVTDTERPTVPTNLSAIAGGTSALLSWTASTDNDRVVGYNIYRSAQNGQLGVLVGSSDSVQHDDDGLAPGTYWYYIKAHDPAGNTSWRSGMKAVTILGDVDVDTERPSVPTNLSVVVGGTSALISWTASTDNDRVVGYNIYRSTQDGELGIEVGRSGSVEHDDDGLAPGTYWYYVKAQDASGNLSWRTGMRSVTIGGGGDTEAPSAPSGLGASLIAGSSNVSLSWNAATDNVGVVSYRVYRTERGVNFAGQVTASTSTSAVDTGVPDGEYSYYVTAIDAAGNEGERSGNSGFVKIGGPAPDTERPSTPTGLSVASVGTTEISLSWRPSSDNVEVTHYVVIDQATGAVVQEAFDANAIVGGLTPGTAYSFFVKAVDGADNWSWRSNVQNFTTAQ